MNQIFYILLIILSKEPGQVAKSIRPEIQDTSYNYCISVIKKYEGFREKPYILFNYRYIGYGSMNKVDSITEVHADSILRLEFNQNLNFVTKKRHKLSYNKRLTLAMLSFNIGCRKVAKSGLLDNDSTFAEQYVKYSFINGKFHKKLNERRKEEIKIYKR